MPNGDEVKRRVGGQPGICLSKRIPLQGKRFGRLVVIEAAPDGKWLCQCDCGNTSTPHGASLRSGGSRSCGCLRSDRPLVVRPTCLVEDCTRISEVRGYCDTCYARCLRQGVITLIHSRRTDNSCARCGEGERLVPSSYCRICTRVIDKEVATRNKESFAEKRKARYTVDARRERGLREYGLTVDDYLALLDAQGGGCAICGVVQDRLCVDHDHACCPKTLRCCGKCVRGLLCANCNNGLGRFSDDPERLERAAAFLRQPTASVVFDSYPRTWVS